ncbi:hypothetical protein P5673_007308 [Acropora cervicornis]|uniref:Peptidase M28 domain-containing protein n=1 Tax=Acropora cervicornis TaxID=6130 RepID=A0AAD9QVR9_ACRCE|nr:hypothetical protein P5673_007308 [Acropora cervicornis]
MCCIQFPAINQADARDRSESLRPLLKHFNENRHHVTNPQGKQRVRQFILTTFQDLGLKVWFEGFKPDYPQYATGVNVVGMIPGTLAGTPSDRLFVIGAHYDTVRTTFGTDDNGSGMVALLQVARQIATDFEGCPRSFSILFVAFDFEEWENCKDVKKNPKCACGTIDCGSRAFVRNLTQFTDGSLSSFGLIQGAIIMDTVMNYNTTPNSQRLPPIMKQFFPETYNELKADQFRGDFLTVVGRQVDDRALMNLFVYHYSQTESDLKNKTSLRWVKLPFQGQVLKLTQPIFYALDDFLRSDHVPFWNHSISLSAVFLSDTAELRGYMTSCYHEDCDGPSKVTPQMLQFLQKTSDVILALTNDVTKMSCPSNSVIYSKKRSTTTSALSLLNPTLGGGMAAWGVALLSIFMILLGAAIGVVATVFYQRWKKQQGPLVTTNVQANFQPL